MTQMALAFLVAVPPLTLAVPLSLERSFLKSCLGCGKKRQVHADLLDDIFQKLAELDDNVQRYRALEAAVDQTRWSSASDGEPMGLPVMIDRIGRADAKVQMCKHRMLDADARHQAELDATKDLTKAAARRKLPVKTRMWAWLSKSLSKVEDVAMKCENACDANGCMTTEIKSPGDVVGVVTKGVGMAVGELGNAAGTQASAIWREKVKGEERRRHQGVVNAVRTKYERTDPTRAEVRAATRALAEAEAALLEIDDVREETRRVKETFLAAVHEAVPFDALTAALPPVGNPLVGGNMEAFAALFGPGGVLMRQLEVVELHDDDNPVHGAYLQAVLRQATDWVERAAARLRAREQAETDARRRREETEVAARRDAKQPLQDPAKGLLVI